MKLIRPDLVPGSLVLITGDNSIGLVLSRDAQHVYLWNVLVGHVVVSVHVSRLQIL